MCVQIANVPRNIMFPGTLSALRYGTTTVNYLRLPVTYQSSIFTESLGIIRIKSMHSSGILSGTLLTIIRIPMNLMLVIMIAPPAGQD